MSELRRLGEIINPTLAKLETSDRARAFGLWARAAGDPVAANARPRGFARGLLTLECSSSIWANELTYLAPQILARMTELEPGNPVDRLRFLTARAPFSASSGTTAGDPPARSGAASPHGPGAGTSEDPGRTPSEQVDGRPAVNTRGRERQRRDAAPGAAVEAARGVGDDRLRAAILAALDRSADRTGPAPADGSDVTQK